MTGRGEVQTGQVCRPSRRRSAALLWAALVLSVVHVVPALAQDGGVRSLFATGSGLRGLAMGGAQTSIAQDAEALDWNPAGLATARRNEFALSRTSYFGEGVTESQIAAVLPSWRWGGLAAGIRHIGVEGVEGRDARNQVTDSNLEASAVQIALGYGRTLGGWSVGSSLEFQREQVAGAGANGIGLDLGVRMRPIDAFEMTPEWMEGVTVGAAWTNVIEPSLRLDEDTVVDPSGFRLGLGYERPFLSGGSLIAAIDIETSAVTDARVHTGLELRLHPVLALRSGLGEHGPTAGAGLHWNDFDLDYVLEETELGSIHRVGFSYSLGRTTDERRLAYVAREEEALQSRLEEASARRELERIDQLLGQAEQLRTAGRLGDAIATVEVARTLAPERTDGIDLEARCWLDRGRELESAENYTDAALAYAHVLTLDPGLEAALSGQERVQAESDRRAKRAEHLRAQFASAMDAFGRGDLLVAREGFAGLVQGKRKDAEAEAMLRRTDDAIGRQANAHVEQARRLLARNLLTEAEAEIERARHLVPKLGAIGTVQADLDRRRAAPDEGVAATGGRRVGTGGPGDGDKANGSVGSTYAGVSDGTDGSPHLAADRSASNTLGQGPSSGTVSPGATSSGATSSGTASPGAMSSGAMSSGATSPGATSSGAMSPGATSSGATSSGAMSPGVMSASRDADHASRERPSSMNDEEIAGLYRRGIEASQSERYEDAIRYFELVHSAAPRHAQVQENLVREYLTLGMERFAGGDLDDAINIWQRALEVDPNDSKARGYLERALRHRDRSQEILGSGR